MKTVKFLILSLLVLTGYVLPAQANQNLNVVVMGEDSDADSVPRSHRVFNRVQRAIMEELNVAGYQVYDETAISIDVTDTSRVGRTDAELIDVAKSIPNPPLDVMTIFEIFASAQKSNVSDVTKMQVRVSGRMINVHSGQSLGSFEVQAQGLPALPPGCDRDCVIEKVGDESKIIAEEVSQILIEKLKAFVNPSTSQGASADEVDGEADSVLTSAAPVASPDCPGLPTAYTISLKSFSAEEVSTIEGYFSAFSCFGSIRPIRQTSKLAEYWYETRADQIRLTRNLKGMEDAMGVSIQHQFSGNRITLTRITTR